ncbi:hypothetical protein PsorP6_011172 [Peronosclerospora sorghi]|uniref:Uncharacterized protein n=1 Tax=Peronosclerospora sorghi TaxID=230839 RepID=A0ACC0VWR9_9STRA|nr:hypothetical protein PsorP6_011172 [Peronosclerospora sorghi]
MHSHMQGLAKTIYSKLFDWMVVQINAAISSDERKIDAQICVLDIFGLEDFVHNRFEQFSINYANEKLQQKFTTDVFKTVEDKYIREGLQWDHIKYQDNEGIVDAIEGKMGIIALMNDHLRQPRDTEEALHVIVAPNSNKSAIEFDKRTIVEQLRSAGVIEVIRITRSGYQSRLTPTELATRYAIMFPPSMYTKDVRRTCSVFMETVGRKSPLDYQTGKP